MRIGVSLPNVGLDHGKEMVLPVAEAAERLGFDSVWAAHHVALPYERSSRYPYGHSGTEVAMSPGMQWLDPLVTLSMVGAVTDRVRLGTSVLVLPYRNPVNLAAEVAALDVLSDGRFVLGVGAGWMQEEFRALGIDPSERGARTDEHIEVLRTLWTQDPASFERPVHAVRGDRAGHHAADRGRAADLGRREHRRGPAPGAAPGRRLAWVRGLPGGHAGRAGAPGDGPARRWAATRRT